MLCNINPRLNNLLIIRELRENVVLQKYAEDIIDRRFLEVNEEFLR